MTIDNVLRHAVKLPGYSGQYYSNVTVITLTEAGKELWSAGMRLVQMKKGIHYNTYIVTIDDIRKRDEAENVYHHTKTKQRYKKSTKTKAYEHE